MFRLSVLILALLLGGGCRRSPEPTTIDQPPGEPRAEPDRLVELTGLYETPGGASRMCIVETRFGIVVRGEGAATCSGSGSGRAERETAGIRFTMQGDSACSFVAEVSGRSLLFPATIPTGCGYYCGDGATLARVRLTQIGTGRTEVMKATDLAGEPLCDVK